MNLGPVARRVVLTVMGSVVLGVGLMIGLGRLTRGVVQDAIVRQLASQVDLEACRADPAAFGGGLGDAFSLYAYDPAGQSRNPAASAITPALLARVERVGDVGHVQHEDGSISEGVARMADIGDCAVLRVDMHTPAPAVFEQLFWYIGFAVLIAILFATGAAVLVVVRPLQRSIARVADEARKVGRDGAVLDTESDHAELSAIAAVLSESHDRIQADRVELMRRHEALEQHLAGIAHDLRTPLSSMQLTLEALVGEASDDARPRVGAALGDVVYLSTLVENLHQGVRLRHGTNAVDGRVDLCGLVRRLGSRFEVIGGAVGIEVAAHAPDRPIRAACAPGLAERAVANLVHNAVTHNREGGHVAVVLEVDGEAFSLRVLDDGPGIPTKVRHRLEDPTFRADLARTRGQGLGLLITRVIAEQAGWTVVWRDLSEGGTEVTVRGPVVP